MIYPLVYLALVLISVNLSYDDLRNKCPENISTNSTCRACRDARQCFRHGQLIRHTTGNNTWTGTYDSSRNVIICNEITYEGLSPLNQFVKSHYETERQDRVPNANAWRECQCEVNGQWISTYNLSRLV